MFTSMHTLFHREREMVVIINECAIPGNGKVAENVCYACTTFQQVPIEVQPTIQNVSYERVGGMRTDETHYYETISDITAAHRDYYNTHLAVTTRL
jgi:hypothetical protein